MMDKQKKVIAGLLVVILGALAYYFMYWTKTPQYSLNLIKEAIKTHNTDKFERHVDLDTLLNKGCDDLLAYYMKTEGKDWGTGMQALATGAVQLMKPSMVATMKSDVLKMVSDTNEAKNDNTAKKPAETKNKNLPMFTAGDVVNKDVEAKGVSVIAKESDVATVAIALHDKNLNKDYDVKLKMNKLENGEWRVKEVTNLIQVVETIDEAKTAKAKELDKVVKEKIYKHVGGHVTRGGWTKSGDWISTYNFKTIVELVNLTDKEVKNIKFFARLFDANGNMVKNIDFDVVKSLAPNAKITVESNYKMNEFDASDKKILSEDLRQYIPLLYVTRLETSDGEVIERPQEVYTKHLYPEHVKEILEKSKNEKK